MALLRNGANLMANTCRAYSGVASNLGGGIAALRGNFNNSGALRNFSAGAAKVFEVSDKSGAPNGYGGNGWLIPNKSGAANSRKRAVVTINSSLVGAMGISSPISTTIAINASLTGGLIVAGAMSALMEISAALDASAVIGGTISATITVDAAIDSALIAHGDMAATMTIDGAIDSVLLAFATMNSEYGTTDLTADEVAAAVWSAAAEGDLTTKEVLRILLAVAAGKTTIVDLGGGAATVTFRNTTDTNDVVIADMTGSERTSIALDP